MCRAQDRDWPNKEVQLPLSASLLVPSTVSFGPMCTQCHIIKTFFSAAASKLKCRD